MAHFAKLDENNIVTNVIVVGNDKLINPATAFEEESLGIAFCENLFGGTWIQTSYNNNFRKRYAGIGYSYNATLDAFVPPQPHASWTLDNETADWVSPLGAAPELTEAEVESGSFYIWNEDAYQADNTTGWELVTLE